MDIVSTIVDNWWIFGAIGGSFLLWKFYGSRIVLKYAGLALERWIIKAYDNPEGQQSGVIGKLCSLGVAHILNNIEDWIPSDPSAPAHPAVNVIFRRIEDHIFKAMSAAFGRQIKRIDGALQNADDPAAALEMAFPMFGEGGEMDGLTQMVSMLRMLGGGKSGGSGEDEGGFTY